MLFSILIPTIAGREDKLSRLMDRLGPQERGGVEIITALDNGAVSIGQKRNQLLNEAAGDWLAFVDDDDLVAEDYVDQICGALKDNPDCVSFKVRRFSDGNLNGEAIHRLSAQRYRSEDRPNNRTVFWRTPNHLNPVRSELARAVGFPEQNFGEDKSYADRLFPLLKTEAFIDAYLYDYLFVSPPRRAHEATNEIHPAIRLWRQAGVTIQ